MTTVGYGGGRVFDPSFISSPISLVQILQKIPPKRPFSPKNNVQLIDGPEMEIGPFQTVFQDLSEKLRKFFQNCSKIDSSFLKTQKTFPNCCKIGFIYPKIPYKYRPYLDLKMEKIPFRTSLQIHLYGVKNTAVK